MLISLLLAAHSFAFAATGSANVQSPVPAWPVEWIADHCPAFQDGSAPIPLAGCRVRESHEFAVFQGNTYFYALYCVQEQDAPDGGSCDDPDSLSSQHSGASAVFVQRGGSETVSLLSSRFEPAGRFGVPRIVENPQGAVMELPVAVGASCDCNASQYYLWRPGGQDWQLMDWESWQDDLSLQLPAALHNLDGFWPDLHTLAAEAPLWRDEDAHCCPGGGAVQVKLDIVENRFVLTSFEIRNDPPEPPH